MRSTKIQKLGGAAGLLASGLVAGGILAGSMTANAADSTTGSTTAGTSVTAPANPNPGDPSKPQRADETLLTGDTLSKVTAAVKAKYPTATIVRAETDSDGVYEAHITKADGSSAIVQVDAAFAVTGEAAMGGGHG